LMSAGGCECRLWKTRAGVGSLFWLRIERRNRKEDRRELYLVTKESFQFESKKEHT